MQVEILIPISFFVASAFVAWFLVKGGIARSEHRLQAHTRMLDRFGSSAEFVAFLQTAEGRRYLQTIALGSRKSQREKILGSVKVGIVLSFLSVGIMLASSLLVGARVGEPPFVLGFIGLFLGVGFLGSAALSWWLAKAWNLDSAQSDQL